MVTKMQNSQYEDFKYVIQDVTQVYIGARFTYGELQERDDIPFKLRAIIAHYILKETAADTTIAEHAFLVKDTDLSYLVWKQMKVRFKVYEWREPDGKKIKKAGYVSSYYTVDEMLKREEYGAMGKKTIVEEISFKKLALMSVSL